MQVVPESDTQLFTSANREAPAMFFANNQYYLWASGCDGWAPTTIHLYTADEPLGGKQTTTHLSLSNKTSWNPVFRRFD